MRATRAVVVPAADRDGPPETGRAAVGEGRGIPALSPVEAGIPYAEIQAALTAAGIPADRADLTIEPVGAGFGLTSRLYRCTARRGGSSHSVVVKLWNVDGPGGTREVAFMRTFGHRLGARLPACHFGAVDSVTGRGVLVLEDLGDVRQGDARVTLPAAPARALARVIAAVHATWWEHPELSATPWLPRVEPVDRGAAWFAERRSRFIGRFGRQADADLVSFLDHAPLLASEADARLDDAPSTLIHADVHLDNVVFSNAEPILLDWARVAIGPAEVDLADLVFGIARSADRTDVLEGYLGELGRRGITVDRSTARRRLVASAIRHAIRSTLGVATWEPKSDREAQLIEVGIARARSALEWLGRTEPSLVPG